MMGNDIKIRLASIEDIPVLRELVNASIRGLSSPEYDARQVESSLRYLFGVDSQLITDETYFVATWEERLVGAGGWSFRKTNYGGDQRLESRDASLRDPSHGDPAAIRAFYVHPDFARRGIARKLMEASEDAAQNAGFTSFELMATLPGVPLYEAFGYRHLSPKSMTLPDGVRMDGVHMAKP